MLFVACLGYGDHCTFDIPQYLHHLCIFSIFFHSDSAAIQVHRNFHFPYLSCHIYFNAAMLIRIILLHVKLLLSSSVYYLTIYNTSKFFCCSFRCFQHAELPNRVGGRHSATSSTKRQQLRRLRWTRRGGSNIHTDHHICVHPPLKHGPFRLLCTPL